MDASREHVIPGSIYGIVPKFPRLPPFIPLPEDGDAQSAEPAMEWDTTVVSHGFTWPRVDNDRRHNGWEEVEKSWIKQQQQQQQSAGQEQQQSVQPTGKSSRPPEKDIKAMGLYPHLVIPTPGLESECDFRMRVKLNSQSASVAVGDGFKKWTTFTEGEWSGRLGYGVVVSGGQDSQDLVYGKTLATQVEATHRLKTTDEIPAFGNIDVRYCSIECKTRGFRTGPPELMRALQDPEKAASVDARLIQYRVALSMKTTDERYAEKVNFGLWVGSCLWRGSEVIYDVYKIT
ncbi:hypothetical protein E0Z10_g5108 [Xylaria hypoxylon]|uniref:Uncharacterized protein n=1 Tax=Xylaria hypoxylon TaxID=37992 RepID=A0A4Z0YJL9_9PEZI|nr:hypothetical protein E0Z10_g5108 [Xylaria hypoxylon]